MNEKTRHLLRQLMYFQWLLGRYCRHHYKTYGPMGNPYYGQGRVLKLLKMQPGITQKKLSYLLGMRPQSLGELLAKLERSGYIIRTPSERDKRVMDIRLTEKGTEAANQDEPQPGFDALFSCLSEEEQANLSEYLDRIIAELEKQFVDDQKESGYHWDGNYEHGFGFEHHGHGGPFFWRK